MPLLLPANFNPAFHADFFHQAGRVETAADNADAADDAGRVGIDFVRRRRDVVAAGRAHIFRHEINGNAGVLRLQTAYFFKSGVGDDGRTAGAVGADDDGFCLRVFVGGLHTVFEFFDLVFYTVADFAVQVDDCGMRRVARQLQCGFVFSENACNQGNQNQGADGTPDVFPHPLPAPVLIGGQQHFAHDVALP